MVSMNDDAGSAGIDGQESVFMSCTHSGKGICQLKNSVLRKILPMSAANLRFHDD